MDEEKSPEFKINIDAVHSDALIREEKKDTRIEKLNQKVTIITILIPCIIIILLLVSYLDIKNKITGVHDSGTMEIQTLSKNIDKKTVELSSLYTKLEGSFERKISALDKTGSALKTDLQDSVKEITAKKADKTEIANTVAEINKQISLVRNDLSAVANKVKGMDTNLSQKVSELARTLGKIENDLARLNTDISGILASKADKKDIELSLRNDQKRYQNELNRFEKDIEDKIDAVRKQLGEIEKKNLKTATPALQQSKQDSPVKPVSKGASSQSGKIVEQDLQ